MKITKSLSLLSLTLLTILLTQATSFSQLVENSQLRNPFSFNSQEKYRFTLRVNQTQTVRLDAGTLEIKLLSIEDSRCPSDVQCIWSGQVTATVGITRNKQNLGSFDLTIRPGQEDLAIQEIDEYSLKLVQVVPYPSTTQNTNSLDYFAALVISPSNLEN